MAPRTPPPRDEDELLRRARALAGRASHGAHDVSEVLATLAEASEPEDAALVDVLGKAIDPPPAATAKGTL